MSKVTLEILEQSFKENMNNVIKQLATEFIQDNDYIPPKELTAKLGEYCEEVVKAAIECGGSVDDVYKWFLEVISVDNVLAKYLEVTQSEEGES